MALTGAVYPAKQPHVLARHTYELTKALRDRFVDREASAFPDVRQECGDRGNTCIRSGRPFNVQPARPPYLGAEPTYYFALSATVTSTVVSHSV